MKSEAGIAAETLYKLAAEAGAEEDIRVQLNVLADSFTKNPRYAALLGALTIPLRERFGMIEALAELGIHPYVANLLKILVQQRFAGEFPEICRRYGEIYDDTRGIAEAEVALAFAIDEEMKNRLQQKLVRICGKQVKMNVKVDLELIGGFRIDMDGKRYDYSVQTQLKTLMERLSGAEG